jgi:hypothetical protein
MPISKSSNVFSFIAPDVNNGFVYVEYDDEYPKPNDVNTLVPPKPATPPLKGFVEVKFSPVVPKPVLNKLECPAPRPTLDKPVPSPLLSPSAVVDCPTVGYVYDDAPGAPLNPNV